MSIDSADSAGQVIRRDPASVAAVPGAGCEGCRARTAQIKQLEQQIELLERRGGALEGDRVANPNFGKARCYWVCVAMNALFTFGLYCSPYTMQIGLVTTLGAIGTLAVCHVFSTRTLFARLLSTSVALMLVIGSAVIASSTQGLADGSSLPLLIVVYLLPMLLTAWFVAKTFVWTRGWRIVVLCLSVPGDCFVWADGVTSVYLCDAANGELPADSPLGIPRIA